MPALLSEVWPEFKKIKKNVIQDLSQLPHLKGDIEENINLMSSDFNRAQSHPYKKFSSRNTPPSNIQLGGADNPITVDNANNGPSVPADIYGNHYASAPGSQVERKFLNNKFLGKKQKDKVNELRTSRRLIDEWATFVK